MNSGTLKRNFKKLKKKKEKRKGLAERAMGSGGRKAEMRSSVDH